MFKRLDVPVNMPPDTSPAGTPSGTVEGIVTDVFKGLLLGSLVGGLIFIAVSIVLGIGFIVDFLSGLIAGTISQAVSLQSSRRGISMAPERAKYFILIRYALRFILLAAVLGLLIFYGGLHPVPLIGGYTVSVFVAIAVTFRAARAG